MRSKFSTITMTHLFRNLTERSITITKSVTVVTFVNYYFIIYLINCCNFLINNYISPTVLCNTVVSGVLLNVQPTSRPGTYRISK